MFVLNLFQILYSNNKLNMLLISESTNEHLIENYRIYIFLPIISNTRRTVGTNYTFQELRGIMLFIREQPTNNWK